MELLKLGFWKFLLLFVFMVSINTVGAQTKRLVLDSETMLPIPYVSIHAKGTVVRGTMSNDTGEYTIDFKYDTLYFSHINYELMKLPNEKINTDTIFMNPTIHTISSVIIIAKNTKWIENILKDVVKHKSQNYQQKEISLDYAFNLKSLSDSSGYAFDSRGKIISPVYSEKDGFKICPTSNIIKYKDESAGPDFMQLRRNVYDDFVRDFDNGFIKKHQFTQTSFEDKENKNIIQFSFKLKKEEGNSGYLMVDTLNKAIKEFEQISDTDYNIKSNTPYFARMTWLSLGVEYTIWRTVIQGQFSLIDGSYHLTDSRYQIYRQNTNKGRKDIYFTNTESHLTMKKSNKDVDNSEDCDWLELPRPWAMTIILSKERSLTEKALDNVLIEYQSF